MNRRLVTLALAGIIAFTGCSSAATTTTTASSTGTTGGTSGGTITVGLEANYAPYNWAQPDDSNGAVKIDGSASFAGGYDVEIAKIIAKGLGKELVVKQIAWEGLIPAVENGAIDLIIAGMSETPERAKSVDFTDVYYDSNYVLLTKKGSKWEGRKGIKDFEGARVVAQKGTNYDVVVPQMTGTQHLTPLGTVPLIVHAIKTEVADLTVVDKSVGISILLTDKDLAMIELDKDKYFVMEDGVTTACSIALKKGEADLKEKINEILKTISIADRDALMEKVVKIQPAGVE